jgi:hypothetical protein
MEDMVFRSVKQHDGRNCPVAALPEDTMGAEAAPG